MGMFLNPLAPAVRKDSDGEHGRRVLRQRI